MTEAVNSQQSSKHLMTPAEAEAMALTFHEEVGLGAISRAGALPLGTSGQWLAFAEDKLKKENSLDHQSLLWELGTEILEKRQMDIGSYNETKEDLLLKGMMDWFVAGGGRLQFVEPKLTPRGYQLFAIEDVENNEPVVSVPMNLIMCQQTARNVVIPNRGRYLGEELQKTFEKNEVWGLALFLLHEYYKDVSGLKSKWAPFIRTLRMRLLTVDTLQVSFSEFLYVHSFDFSLDLKRYHSC